MELLKVAYAEGHRALDQQYSALNSIRQRCVQYMAFVGSATAFLVGSTIAAPLDRAGAFYVSVSIATVISLTSLVFLFLILLSIARKREVGNVSTWDPEVRSAAKPHDPAPRKWGRAEWNFSVNPEALIQNWIDPKVNPATESDFYRDLALHSQAQLSENDFYLDQVYTWYNWFVALATLQVIAWTFAVWMFV